MTISISAVRMEMLPEIRFELYWPTPSPDPITGVAIDVNMIGVERYKYLLLR